MHGTAVQSAPTLHNLRSGQTARMQQLFEVCYGERHGYRHPATGWNHKFPRSRQLPRIAGIRRAETTGTV
jgi:hypothetical protein